MARWLAVLLVALVLPLAAAGTAAAQERVDLELILLADGSGSVDEEEFLLQRRGYARALRNPRVLSAIRNGPLGRIALTYVEWSGHFLKASIVPWTVLSDAASVVAFAQQLENRPRELYGGGTAVGSAIIYGATSIQENAFEGTRKVIDISGDGPDKDGLPAAMGRDQAVALGFTVNGLPILGTYPALEFFFLDNVIGGPGAFSIPANTFKDVEAAILTKLIREIAGVEDADAVQAAEAPTRATESSARE